MKTLNKGFSLVELLVVIAIIGVLAAVGVTTYQGYIQSAKEGNVASNHNALVAYMTAEVSRCQLGSGSFAGSDGTMDSDITDGAAVSCQSLEADDVAMALANYVISVATYENPNTGATYDTDTIYYANTTDYTLSDTSTYGDANASVSDETDCDLSTIQACPDGGTVGTAITGTAVSTRCDTDAEFGNIYILSDTTDPGADYIVIQSCQNPDDGADGLLVTNAIEISR